MLPPGAAREEIASAPPVYVVVSIRPKPNTGVQAHVEAFMRYARRAGVPVSLVTPFDAPRCFVYPFFGIGHIAKLADAAAWLAWHRYSHHVVLRWRLQRLLSRRAPSILYAQSPVAAKVALDLRETGYPVEVVMMAHFNGSEADEWVDRGFVREGDSLYSSMRALERDVVARADRVVFPSRFLGDAWRHEVPPLHGRVWHVPNFVFEPPPVDGSGWSGDLITVGTLEPRKNQQFLIEVVAAARQRGHTYRLTIVGDGAMAPRLRAQAASLGVSDCVALTGFLPRASSLLHAHRAYVHGARIENCPIALLEAMAAGRPVCAAPVGGIPELFRDGIEGVYWDLSDPEGAASMLIGLLEDEAGYASMAGAARARYETCFASDVVGPRLLQAVCGERSTPAERLTEATWRP